MPAFTITTNGESGILQIVRKIVHKVNSQYDTLSLNAYLQIRLCSRATDSDIDCLIATSQSFRNLHIYLKEPGAYHAGINDGSVEAADRCSEVSEFRGRI